MTDPVNYSVENKTAILTMDDGKANALNEAMIGGLSAGLDRAEQEADAVIIMGRPGMFSAGFDLKVLSGPSEGQRSMVDAGARLLLKGYLFPKPIVIACSGHAIAAGALMTLTGDFRVGVAGAFRLGLNETAIGLPLPVFGQELARDRLDKRTLTNAVINATLYSPEEARVAGFLDQVVAEERLLGEALDVAERLKQLDPAAFRAIKTQLRGDTGDRIRQSLSG